MTSGIRRSVSLAALVSALALAGCLGGGNSGSETTNGLAGAVTDVEGRPVAGARVLLLPEEYNPAMGDSAGPVLSAVTDAKGRYRMEDVAPGHYHLELSDSARDRLSLIRDVDVAPDSVTALDGTLGRPGALTARIADFIAAGESGYMYIPGTTAWLRLGGTVPIPERATLDRVPVGRFARLVLVVDAASDRKIIALAQDFEVFSESTSAIPAYQSWKSTRRIPVNTLAAGVQGTVTDFPFLIRLDAGGFDFSQAERDGKDIRFSKPDGTPIPYQVERWDPQAGRAEIWARLDTVAGASADQYITMHWGRELTASAVGEAEVFDSAAGFSTVYHFNESANEDPGGYKDATPYANHATSAAVNGDAQAPGIIGSAKTFAGGPGSSVGTLSAATPAGFGGNASFTVSFWLRFSPVPQRQTVLDFGTPGLQTDVHFLIHTDTLTQFGAFDQGASGSDPAPWQEVFKLREAVGRWAHVATVYDASVGTLKTYVNGVLADSIKASPMNVDSLGGLRIGRNLSTHPQDAPLNGALDEVRFLHRVLDADRIRLDYETQKP